MIIGITGGVGCGKSTVMSVLKNQFMAKTILADEIGHQAMQPGEEPYIQICRALGQEAIKEDGKLDRDYLSKLIYNDEEKRNWLNSIIHPYVLKRMEEQILQWQGEPLIAIETAIMFESGCDKFCDKIWYVKTDKSIRINRLMESRGYTREKAESIMAAQMSDEEGNRLCDACIENNTTIEKIEKRLQELLGIQ